MKRFPPNVIPVDHLMKSSHHLPLVYFTPNSLAFVYKFSYLPAHGEPDNKTTFFGFNFKINFVRFDVSCLTRLDSSKSNVKFVNLSKFCLRNKMS